MSPIDRPVLLAYLVFASLCCATFLWATSVIGRAMVGPPPAQQLERPAPPRAARALQPRDAARGYFRAGSSTEATRDGAAGVALSLVRQQVRRVALARALPLVSVNALVTASALRADTDATHEPRVNVLALNLALDVRAAQAQ